MSYNLSFIAQNLRTRHEGKKHGGYDIYEDDKVSIWYDTYFPNVSVYLMDEAKTCVYSRSGHGIVSIHRPGAWEAYCESLMPRAKAAGAEKASIIAAKNKREHDAAFGGVNDSALFSRKEP